MSVVRETAAQAGVMEKSQKEGNTLRLLRAHWYKGTTIHLRAQQGVSLALRNGSNVFISDHVLIYTHQIYLLNIHCKALRNGSSQMHTDEVLTTSSTKKLVITLRVCSADHYDSGP